MQNDNNRKKLAAAIDEAVRSLAARGTPFTSTDVACRVTLGLAIENPGRVAALRDQITLESVAATSQRAMRRAVEKAPDERQGWLALPEYEHVPKLIKAGDAWIDVNRSSLEQYRAAIVELAVRIDSYDYARRAEGKRKKDRKTLTQMRHQERNMAGYFAGDPGMTVGRAMELYQASLKTPAMARWSKGGKAKAARTKNQQLKQK